LNDPAEKALHAALLAAAPKISAAKASKEYQQAFETIATLRPQVDAFFDTVMVMAEEEDLRRNRLALLTKLKNEVSAIAHLEEMGGEDAR
jgi:glycyl-tRNA synthetase beta chain